MGGKLTTNSPHTCEAKNTGKLNATTAKSQAIKEAAAKWEYKLAHGYTANTETVDMVEYKEPMLAKQFNDYADEVTYPVYIDQKLNGMRCNATASGVKSRKGKNIHTISHIVKALVPLFKKYPALYLDGELYNPVYKNSLNKLIELTSVGIKLEDVTPELRAESEKIVQFHIYDGFGYQGIESDSHFKLRRDSLRVLLKNTPYVCVLRYSLGFDLADVMSALANTKKEGGEGVIIRWGNCPYEFKRSKYLLKLKNFISEEFRILDVEQGNGSWVGCVKRVILELPHPTKDRDGNVVVNFASNIEGSVEWLRQMWQDRAKVIGQLATCEFQEYSNYGIPLIGYVRSIRNYE